MADRQEIFYMINELLENTEYPGEVKNLSDLESFLEDDENQQYEEFGEVERLYSELMEDSDLEEE